MENQRETQSRLLNMVKNMIIPGRLSNEIFKDEKDYPNRKDIGSREKILLHAMSYVIPIAIWTAVIYKAYDLLN